jgi:hypothetical protein
MDIPAHMLPLKEAVEELKAHETILEEIMRADENERAHEITERLFLRLLSHLSEPAPFDRKAYVNAAIAAGLKKPAFERIRFAEAAYREHTISLYAAGIQAAAGAAILIATICECRGLRAMRDAWLEIAQPYVHDPNFFWLQAAE